MIDTHCHILPGVDDGAKDTQTSLEMAALARDRGTTAIIATPHVIEGVYDAGDLRRRHDDLSERITAAGIDLELHLGAEVPMSLGLQADAEQLAKLTLAGSRYLLVETAETSYELLSRTVYQVRLHDLYPVLAHPERAAFVQKKTEPLEKLVATGDVFCQITAASLTGQFGKGLKKLSSLMLRSGLVHLVASDAHSSGVRSPGLEGAFRELERQGGEQIARQIMLANAESVVSDSVLKGVPASDGRGALLKHLRKR